MPLGGTTGRLDNERAFHAPVTQPAEHRASKLKLPGLRGHKLYNGFLPFFYFGVDAHFLDLETVLAVERCQDDSHTFPLLHSNFIGLIFILFQRHADIVHRSSRLSLRGCGTGPCGQVQCSEEAKSPENIGKKSKLIHTHPRCFLKVRPGEPCDWIGSSITLSMQRLLEWLQESARTGCQIAGQSFVSIANCYKSTLQHSKGKIQP